MSLVQQQPQQQPQQGGNNNNMMHAVVGPSSSSSSSRQRQQQQQQQQQGSSGRGSFTSPPPPSPSYLQATILSAYDLPLRDPPSHVQLTLVEPAEGDAAAGACGKTQSKTGPPSQRHKDKNSFKFTPAPGQTARNTVQLVASLPELYNSTVRVELVYKDAGTGKLIANYPVKQLVISETSWMILNLRDPNHQEHEHEHDDEHDDDHDRVPPTLRLSMTLHGPYRPEVAAFLRVSEMWFGLIDGVETQACAVIRKLPTIPIKKEYLLVPAVPIVAVVVVCSPVIVGVLIAGLPMLLPAAVVFGFVLAVALAGAAVLYGSSSTGRSQVGAFLRPVFRSAMCTTAGQRLVYCTGQRPSPVGVAKAVLPGHENMTARLIVSLMIDAAGSSSYLLPIVGEATDVIWAPVQTILIMALYESVSTNLKYLSFVEEILPFTDVVPTATLGWLIEYGLPLLFGVVGVGQNKGGHNKATNSMCRDLSNLDSSIRDYVPARSYKDALQG